MTVPNVNIKYFSYLIKNVILIAVRNCPALSISEIGILRSYFVVRTRELKVIEWYHFTLQSYHGELFIHVFTCPKSVHFVYYWKIERICIL